MTAPDSTISRPQTSNQQPIVDVIIVGTGFAGLGLAIKLKERGDVSFTLLERASDVGGTWRDNSYPGVACDVPSPLYSFSFRPNPDWSNLFAPGPEIWQYLKALARDEGLLDHVRFETPMTGARWDEQDKLWIVRSGDRVFPCRYLITATGHLSDWHMPDLPGIERFKGKILHSAAWKNDVPIAGKRVGIIGSGASAIQLIPEVAKIAAELVVFQRSPAYVQPRPVMPLSEAQRRTFRRAPAELVAFRDTLFWLLEQSFAQRLAIPQFIEEATATALRHLEMQVPDPALRAKLTPDYAIGCKRVLISNEFYPALGQPHVHLEASAATKLTETGVVSAADNAFDLDVIIFATGFEAVQPPYAELVRRGDGVSLAERWSSGMQAYASTTVSGFPNMFIINGPNTSSGYNSALLIIEAQIDYILGALDFAHDQALGALDVTPEAEERYVREIEADSQHTVWVEGGCKNWYVDQRSGRNTLVWPEFSYTFRDRYGTFSPHGYAVQSLPRSRDEEHALPELSAIA